MEIKRLSAVYFSATSTTYRCVMCVASGIGLPMAAEVNLADRVAQLPEFGPEDAVIVATPVYGGRIPALAAEGLNSLSGRGAKAVAMVVYGNRDYDDALLELHDLLTANGFTVVAASAFVGCHSIFPKVGAERPDEADEELLREFGRRCYALLTGSSAGELRIKGNRPYKKYAGVPVHPVGARNKCRACGTCVRLCPVEAIDAGQPWLTDASRCISCGRCIAVCSQRARGYKGLTYRLIGSIFTLAFSRRKEPELIYPGD